MKQFTFTHQGYDCVVADFRGVSKPFIQVSVKDPNAPDRLRVTSISTANSDEVIPTDSELVNYVLARQEVQNMLGRIVQDGFPTSYDEGS